MALRSRIITYPNEVLRIIDNMTDSEKLSDDDNSNSDDNVISPTSNITFLFECNGSDDNQPVQEWE